jgi:hypothetical protein
MLSVRRAQVTQGGLFVNKSFRCLGAVLLALFCVAVTQVRAADTDDRRYALADHGSLQLTVPTVWKEEIEQDRDRLLPTIAFAQKAGAPFGVVLTPIWPTEKGAPSPDRRALRRLVEGAAEEVKSLTVEETIEVIELEGASGVGYYFSVTDRAPKPGNYKHMTQGILPVGSLMVPFTIYTNDGQQDIVADALTMLKSAIHSNGNGS